MLLTIRTKIFLSLLFVALFSLSLIGFVGYQSSKSALSEASFSQLKSLRQTRKYDIEEYLISIRNRITELSESEMTINALKDFEQEYNQIKRKTDNRIDTQEEQTLKSYYKDEVFLKIKNNQLEPKDIDYYLNFEPQTYLLQYHYIASISNYGKNTDKKTTSNNILKYDMVHSKYHEKFLQIAQKFNFHNIYLIDLDGNICYSENKECDFATNLQTGPYKNTALADVYQKASILESNKDTLSDFQSYDPAYGNPAAFIATPIFDNGIRLGVLVVQISIKGIDKIMTGEKKWRDDGFGETGETYLVGNDLRMRSNSRFLIEDKNLFLKFLKKNELNSTKINLIDKMNTTILQIEINSVEAKESILSKKTDCKIVNDYRNVTVLSAYAPLNIPGVNWSIVCQMDEKEAFLKSDELLNKFLWYTGGVVLLVFGFSVLMSNTIGKPIATIRDFMRNLSTGELPDKPIPVKSKDEIGQMNMAANELVNGLRNAVNFAKEIEKGNFDYPFQPLSENDSVGNALVQMQFGLKTSVELQHLTLQDALSAEFELRKNTEKLHNLNEELNTKQRDLITSNAALKESETNLEKKIEQRTIELSSKNQLLMDSINYAKNIQLALLPTSTAFKKIFHNSFVIYRPKDVVAGDFYWISNKRNKSIIVAADCTGHGVPGAFMSLLGINALNQVIRDYGYDEATNILIGEIDQKISALLLQGYSSDMGSPKDGMDLAMCVIDTKTKKISYSGAGRPLYYTHKGNLEIIKGSPFPIGTGNLYANTNYVCHNLELEEGDCIYLFTDGFTDQFDANDKKKFGAKKAKELILSIQGKSMDDQCHLIENSFDIHKGMTEQTDDLLIIGIQI